MRGNYFALLKVPVILKIRCVARGLRQYGIFHTWNAWVGNPYK